MPYGGTGDPLKVLGLYAVSTVGNVGGIATGKWLCRQF